MKKLTYCFLFIISCSQLIAQSSTEKPYVVIEGELRDYTRTFGEGEEYKVKQKEIYILNSDSLSEYVAHSKAKKGKISFKFYYDEFKLYRMTNQLGTANSLLAFYPDADTIRFHMYNDDEYGVSGGDLTNDYIKKLNGLYDQQKKEREKIVEKYGNAITEYKNGKTIKVNPIAHEKFDSLNKIFFANYFSNKIDEPKLSDIDIFLNFISIPNERLLPYLSRINNLAIAYTNKFEDNELYSNSIKGIVENLNSNFEVKQGNNYKNIFADNAIDEKIELATFVGESDYLLVDLWASWCGPCINKSKKTIPVYEKFNKNGFEVFSVLVDVEKKSDYLSTVSKYKYPWEVYTELNHKYNIRNTYGFNNAGGVQVLLDKQGEILKINPTIEELTETLEKHISNNK